MKKCILLALLVLLLIAANILVGSVHIPASDVLSILTGDTEGIRPSWQYIVLQSRLPQAITATLAGGALAVSGLMLQTAFRNPLADPGIFGISSGAGLGVALVMLFLGGSITAGTVALSGFLQPFWVLWPSCWSSFSSRVWYVRRLCYSSLAS